MNLIKTPVPGMSELSGVGYASSQDSYNKAMTSAKLKGCRLVVASLTVDQKEGVSILLKNGFTQVGGAKRNPNTGHMILLLIKSIHP